MHVSSPVVPVTSAGPVSSAAVAWRARGTLYLTVVVKATFTLVSEGRMSLAEPDPIAAGEQPLASGAGLRTAGDLAPYLGQPEVWLTGHAAVPPRFSEPSLTVRLAVMQAGALRVDKQLELEIAGAAGAPGAVGIAGMGPIAADWPIRSRWLAGLDTAGLQGSQLTLPDGLHWEYFQTSPLDQRLDAIRGDEWLILGGMVPQRPVLRTQLPAARGAARLYRRTQASPREGEPIPLHPDTLQIDVDRLRCSILFRGRVQLAGDADLPLLHLVAGLEQAGAPVGWADPFPPEQPSIHGPSSARPSPEIPFAGTMGLSDDQAARLGQLSAMPFGAARAPEVATRLAAPREGPRARASAEEIPFTGTTDLSFDLAGKLAAAMATPFEAPKAPAPADDVPFAGTMALSGDLAERLAAAEALPFDRNRAPSFDAAAPSSSHPARASASGGEIPFTGTMALSDDLDRRLAAALATPFDRPREPAAAQEIPRIEVPVPPLAPAPFVAPMPAPPVMLAPLVPPPEPALPVEPASRRAGESASTSLRDKVLDRLHAKEALQGLPLAGADLHDLDLRSATLAGLDLRRANLHGANLSGVIATEVLLEGADLGDAKLERAELTRANLARTTLGGATFAGATLTGANLQRAVGDGASFRAARLQGADLRLARLQGAVFDDAILREIVAVKTDLAGARFVGADLSGANLREAKLRQANLARANLEGADFRDADLARANVHGASRKSAKITAAQEKGLVEVDPGQRAT